MHPYFNELRSNIIEPRIDGRDVECRYLVNLREHSLCKSAHLQKRDTIVD